MEIAIVGGGPAGLRAAEMASKSQHSVTIFDAMASAGRKFLVAGRGGLNLTHGEAIHEFATKYVGPDMPGGIWDTMLADFSPQAVLAWAHGLGIETFQAKTGRIYPIGMKAAPILRRWISRLREAGVQFSMHHKLTGVGHENGKIHLRFTTPARDISRVFDAVVLALGGGSWPQTGSDGSWRTSLLDAGIQVHPLTSANCGWECTWTEKFLKEAEGLPLKNIEVHAAGQCVRGELLITSYGLEGGCIYQLGQTLRSMAAPQIQIDLKPTFSVEELAAKVNRHGENLLKHAIRQWKLSPAAAALLAAATPSTGWRDAPDLAATAKRLSIPLHRARPLAEAISSAGGVCWTEVDYQLMLKKLPGIFVAGEMLDWEAPTGGYLIQGCLSTGTRAGTGALDWLESSSHQRLV